MYTKITQCVNTVMTDRIRPNSYTLYDQTRQRELGVNQAIHIKVWQTVFSCCPVHSFKGEYQQRFGCHVTVSVLYKNNHDLTNYTQKGFRCNCILLKLFAWNMLWRVIMLLTDYNKADKNFKRLKSITRVVMYYVTVKTILDWNIWLNEGLQLQCKNNF